MKISICLATYNGEKYIEDQIKSILPQLNEGDELLILDDGSADTTLQIIRNFNSDYITIHENENNLGHVKTFEKLLSLAKNEIIFMCDQDDIWAENKVKIFKNHFRTKKLLISDNSLFIDQNGKVITSDILQLSESSSADYVKNIADIYKGSAGYYGCGMALKRDLLKVILPIPSYVESHDLWIAMAANLLKSNLHINDQTFYRRIHGENDSLKSRKFSRKMYSRYIFLRSHIALSARIKNYVKQISN